MGATFQIPDQNLVKLRAEIDKLGKRAEKLTGERIRLMVLGFNDTKHEDGTVSRYWDVFVSGPEPKLNGFTFIARVDHANEVGNIIRSVPGEYVPQRYRNAPGNCEHCGHDRYRRDTFLVKEEETGQVVQVGSSCLKDYVGHGDPQATAKLAELYGYANELAGYHGEREVGVDHRFLDVESFGAHTMAMCRLYGWTPKSRADEDHRPTSMLALDNMFPQPQETATEVTDEDHTRAQQALEWIQSQDAADSDWVYNCSVVAASGVMEMRSAGLAASIFGVWFKKNVEEAAQYINTQNSEYVGRVKERMDLTVRVLFTKVIDSVYGTSTMHKMADENGNLFVWFNSGRGDLVKGRTYNIKGTVKAHQEYQGVKQTMLNRVKVQENELC
jgi:hypothetical protein